VIDKYHILNVDFGPKNPEKRILVTLNIGDAN